MTQAAQPSLESQEMLKVLQQAVAEALDKKRRLGQYAVVWKEGKPVWVADVTRDTNFIRKFINKNNHSLNILF